MPIDIDRKVGKWDSNSVGRSECCPMVHMNSIGVWVDTHMVLAM